MRHRSLHRLLIILPLFFCNNLEAQKISDSIQTLEYFHLFDLFEYEDTLKARTYADSGMYFAKQSGNNELIGRAHQYMGWYYQDHAKYQKATNHFYKSLNYLRKSNNRQGIADAYGNLGNSFLDVEDYRNSLDNQLKSLTVNEEIIDSKPSKKDLIEAVQGRTYALHNIGAVYSEISMFDKALEYEFKSLKHEIEGGNEVGEAISYNTLGTIHKELKNLDSAVIYFEKALKIYEEHVHPYGLASTLLAYATLEGSVLSEEKKISMIKESLGIREDMGDADGEARTLIEICDVYFDDISTDSLSITLQRAFDIIEADNLEILRPEYFKIYSKYYSRLGEYKDAFFALENYLDLKAISDEKSRAHDLIVADVKHQLITKFQTDSLQTEYDHTVEHAGHMEDVAYAQNIIYLGVIGFIILIGSLFYFVNSNRRKNRLNDILSEKNNVIQEQKNSVDEQNRSISDSINYARRLQTAILPTSEQINEFLPDSFLFFRPKDVVSGDFHWFETKGDYIFLAVADCTGHGVPGALVSVVCSNALNRSVNEFGLIQPKDILDQTRDLVIDTFAKSGDKVTDGMDISLIAIDKKSQKVIFSGAQNSLWIVRDNDKIDATEFQDNRVLEDETKSLIEFKGNKQPIGLYLAMDKFTQVEIDLKENDLLYMFSDGFADQFGGEKGKKFKYVPFKKELLSNSGLPMDEQKTTLINTFENWQGDQDQIDDICVMGIRVPS